MFHFYNVLFPPLLLSAAVNSMSAQKLILIIAQFLLFCYQ